MQMAYNGSHAAVDVPALGLFGVERGEPVTVHPDNADQLAAQGWTEINDNNDDKEGNN